ncbi:glycosyl transferase family 1 [Cryptosporangium minutisporangium]|uniref:Glycosyltransferase n=1 Tax=Cryptosporangium minutisporangium TaxID=113569 RepID=A0ABP6T0P4_9ACTN
MTVRYSFVSTYPPTRCGLAGYTASLRAALPGDDAVDRPVIRVTEEARDDSPPEVVAELLAGDRGSLRRAASEINLTDVAIVQYEDGLYGGPDGEEVLALLDAIRVPRIVVLRTVPAAPSWRQRWVLQSILDRSEAIVLLTVAAKNCLAAEYRVAPSRLHVIPYGAHPVGPPAPVRPRGRPTVVTWALLGPGEGIEWGIDALRELHDLEPRPQYVIAGPTHPRVLALEGEAYRERLSAHVRRCGLDDYLHFDEQCGDAASLERLIAAADVVLLPYDSPTRSPPGC